MGQGHNSVTSMFKNFAVLSHNKRARIVVASGLAGSLYAVVGYALTPSQPLKATSSVGQTTVSASSDEQISQPSNSTHSLTIDTSATPAAAPTPASSSSENTAQSSTSPDTSVHVNGTKINVPKNGHVYKHITNSGGNTKLNISINSTSSKSGQSESNVDLQVNSSSEVQKNE